jgi:cAMP phosphodiesterase
MFSLLNRISLGMAKTKHKSFFVMFSLLNRIPCMAKTKHIRTRMNQRAIDQELLDLARTHGVVENRGAVERVILSRKTIDAAIRHIDSLRKQFLKVRDKGGIVLVRDPNEGVDITTYRLSSCRQNRSRKKPIA